MGTVLPDFVINEYFARQRAKKQHPLTLTLDLASPVQMARWWHGEAQRCLSLPALGLTSCPRMNGLPSGESFQVFSVLMVFSRKKLGSSGPAVCGQRPDRSRWISLGPFDCVLKSS